MKALGRFINFLIVVAWLGGAYFIYLAFTQGPARHEGSLVRMPGQTTVALEAKDYKVWTRNPEGGTLSKNCFEDSHWEELQKTGVTLRPAGGGAPVPLTRTGCSRTNMDGIQSSIAKFEVPKAGSYVLATTRNPAPSIPVHELYLGGGGLSGTMLGVGAIAGLMAFSMLGGMLSARLMHPPRRRD